MASSPLHLSHPQNGGGISRLSKRLLFLLFSIYGVKLLSGLKKEAGRKKRPGVFLLSRLAASFSSISLSGGGFKC